MRIRAVNIDWNMVERAIYFGLIALLLYVCFNYRGKYLVAENNRKSGAQTITQLQNADGTKTATITAQQMTIAQLKTTVLEGNASLKEQIKRFAKVTSVTRATAVARIDTVRAKFDQPIVGEFKAADSTTTTTFSRSGTIWQDWFRANYAVDQEQLQLTDLQATISTTTITGFKRKWFWGKQTATTDVTPTDKNVTITQVVSTSVVVPVRWYETTVAKVAAGVLLKSLVDQIKIQ